MAFERHFSRAARVLVSSLIGLAALVEVAPANACSCSIPFRNELRTGDGQIPANAGVPWWFAEQQTAHPLESFVTIERIEGAARVPVSATIERFEGVFVIRPELGWAVGERYRISVDAGPEQGTPEQRFRAAEIEITSALEATMPLEISTSAAQQRRLRLVDRGGSCASDRDAVVVELRAGAPEGRRAFPLDLLYYTTYVDGVPWRPSSSLCENIEPGTSWTGRSSDRLVAVCDGFAYEEASLTQGEHAVRMVARLPGTDVTFETPERIVDIRCGTNLPGAVDDEDEAGVTTEPGVNHAAAPARNPVIISDSAEGCSLSGAPALTSASAFGVSSLLATVVLGWRRRRHMPAALRGTSDD